MFIGRETLRDFRTSAADLAVVSPGEPLHLSGPSLTEAEFSQATRLVDRA